MGPLSLDIFKKNNLSASWKVFGAKTTVVDTSEVRMTLILLLESTVVSCTLFVLLINVFGFVIVFKAKPSGCRRPKGNT